MDSILKEALKNILIKTFETIDNIYKYRTGYRTGEITNTAGSRLIFPCYSDQNKTNQHQVRVSEQELRFVFIETFCRYCDSKELNYYYSIETPSQYKYVFSEKIESGKPLPRKADKDDESPVSARFDMAIHDKYRKIVALVEFKNNESDSDKYEKDFIKLYEEKEERICLFIDLIEASNSGTLKGIKKRLSKIHTPCKGITYIAHSMCPRNKKSFQTVYDGDLFKGIDGWEQVELLNKQ